MRIEIFAIRSPFVPSIRYSVTGPKGSDYSAEFNEPYE